MILSQKGRKGRESPFFPPPTHLHTQEVTRSSPVVSTNGGVGKVPGILVGVLVFEILKICLQFLRVDPAYTFIAQGLVIIVAVALDLRKYLAKK